MIRYALECDGNHRFDSWFQSAEAFDRLARAGQLSCPACGSFAVTKALMSPRITGAKSPETDADSTPVGGQTHGSGGTAAPPARRKDNPPAITNKVLQALNDHLEKNFDYVGRDFPREARAIHAMETPDRRIYGEANPDEARELVADGIPVAPLGFRPRRHSH